MCKRRMEFTFATPSCTLGDIRWNDDRRSTHLRAQTQTFVNRRSTGSQVDVPHQPHGFLPYLKIMMSGMHARVHLLVYPSFRLFVSSA